MGQFFSSRSLLPLAVVAISTFASVLAKATPIRELADFAGVRDNQLVGYGLVVGLDGSGDQTMQTPFTTQSLTNMFSQLGITIPAGTNMQLRNVAGVMVTAQLPAFARPGQRLDVVVSSIGNARSLRGGTLLMTPLKGLDGRTYAVAQGNLLVGGAGAESGGSSVQVNQQAGGRISGGALVEREVAVALGAGGYLDLQLREADFGTAERVVDAINRAFGSGVAGAVDAGLIRMQSPVNDNERVRFIARVQSIDVTPQAPPARVVLNARSGAVVLNGQVTLGAAAVAHGNLSIVIDTAFGVSQPAPFSSGETVVVPDSDITVRQQAGTLKFVEGANLLEVVDALNALGATPADLMTILEALKVAGALRAELEII
ncbi:flagellar basal body P-ring protein FlgI [Microbulbifer sp. SA54]|uniref:flagellar basal body P-ring protein FlgI n=1 Tax=Microbulbifer sp. SA54 TaxID=3401577 RepID=UPI003AAF9B2D